MNILKKLFAMAIFFSLIGMGCGGLNITHPHKTQQKFQSDFPQDSNNCLSDPNAEDYCKCMEAKGYVIKGDRKRCKTTYQYKAK